MKLKPCPFCGEDGAKICEVPVKSDYKIIVRCTWCCVQTTPRNNETVASLDWNNRARVENSSHEIHVNKNSFVQGQIEMRNRLPSTKKVDEQDTSEKRATVLDDDDGEAYIPHGYSVTLDCLNQPKSWDVPGMIADIAENIRRGNEVPEGQVLAALDWMTFRLNEARPLLVAADSELSAVAHGRPVDKEESKRISRDSRELCDKLKGY